MSSDPTNSVERHQIQTTPLPVSWQPLIGVNQWPHYVSPVTRKRVSGDTNGVELSSPELPGERRGLKTDWATTCGNRQWRSLFIYWDLVLFLNQEVSTLKTVKNCDLSDGVNSYEHIVLQSFLLCFCMFLTRFGHIFVTNEDFHDIWFIGKNHKLYCTNLIWRSRVKGQGHETGMNICLGHIFVTNKYIFTKFGL